MIDNDRPDRPDLTAQDLTEQDPAVATLVDRYIEGCALHQAPCIHDLLAVAAEFSDAALTELRDVLAFYEAMRASEDHTR